MISSGRSCREVWKGDWSLGDLSSYLGFWFITTGSLLNEADLFFSPAWHFEVGRCKRRNTEQLCLTDSASQFSRSPRYSTEIRYNSLLVLGRAFCWVLCCTKGHSWSNHFRNVWPAAELTWSFDSTILWFCEFDFLFQRAWMSRWKWRDRFSRCHSWLTNNKLMSAA